MYLALSKAHNKRNTSHKHFQAKSSSECFRNEISMKLKSPAI